MPSKKLLITLHGINSRGEWQDQVVGTLSRNFACESLKYDGYHFLGFFRNCFSLWLLPLLALAVGAGVFWSKPIGVLSVFIVFALSFCLACRKRARLIKKISEDYDKTVANHGDGRPHAIAHSFGTYLLCSAVAKFPGVVTFDRMVLFGSVVNVAFGWAKLAKAGAITAVRNETGLRDYVARVAGWAFWIRGIGSSGIEGFEGSTEIVENVQFDEFEHSDAPRLRKHIQLNWLPFFWGIPPVEYRELLGQCERCLDDRVGEHIPPADAFREFNSKEWSWTLEHGIKVSFRRFLEACIHEFYARGRAREVLESRVISACYALARDLFCSLCQKHDDHPRLIAVRVAEKALSAYFLTLNG